MSQPFEPKDPQKIIDRYVAGETAKQIGLDYGYLQAVTIKKFLLNAGVPLRPAEEEREIERQRRRK